jgi:hypothetical protein
MGALGATANGTRFICLDFQQFAQKSCKIEATQNASLPKYALLRCIKQHCRSENARSYFRWLKETVNQFLPVTATINCSPLEGLLFVPSH